MTTRSILKLFDKPLPTALPVNSAPAPVTTLFTKLKSTTTLQIDSSREARIVGYARRSSKRDGSDSIDRQRRALEDYAKRKFGRPLDDFYADPSISGRTWNRPGLQQLMKDAQNGRFTDIIVEDVDRIARLLHIAAEFKHKCDNWNVKIHSSTKGAEIESADVAMRGFMSADNIKIMRERSMEGMRRAAERGGATSSMPFGYVRTTKGRGDWAIDESKRKVVEWIFDARLDGMSYALIARILNTNEILENTGEGVWEGSSVRDLLGNPKYMGVSVRCMIKQRLDPETGTYKVEHNPVEDWIVAERDDWAIISKTKWQAVLETLHGPTKQKLKRPHSLLNSEHTVCASCGSKLQGYLVRRANDPGVWELRCKIASCRERKGHRVKMIEEQMLNAVRLVLNDPEYGEAFEARLAVEYERMSAELLARRKSIEDRIEKSERYQELLLDELLELRERKKLAHGNESDEDHAIDADRIARRVSRTKSEQRAARQELAMLPPAPGKLDRAKRTRLLDAFDRVVRARSSDAPRSEAETGLLLGAEAAIGNLVESIKVGAVYPGRASRIEVVLKLDAMFGNVIKEFGDGRRSIVTVVHIDRLSSTRTGWLVAEVADGYKSRVLAATDEQFEVLEPAISPRIRGKLAQVGYSAREFIDLIFLMTRANVSSDFLITVMPEGISNRVRRAVCAAMVPTDGTWKRIFSILQQRYPDLYREMKPDIHISTRIKENAYMRARYAKVGRKTKAA